MPVAKVVVRLMSNRQIKLCLIVKTWDKLVIVIDCFKIFNKENESWISLKPLKIIFQ